MKNIIRHSRIISLMVFVSIFITFTISHAKLVYAASIPVVESPSAILMEASTGVVIYEKDADKILHPASITKIMTLILIFDAISEGKIALDDEVTVSENAAGKGGSQVFLEAGEIQTVDTLIKCIAVASANDACAAMAEYIWGSEEVFVEKMNERAKGLGMRNTTFVNCHGLDADNHLSTVRDVAFMSRELITKYPQIHEYSTIWMDTIIHSTRRGDEEFGLTNTNKLIKQYEWATGLKTGSTSQAGFCLSATANRNGIDLIAVVMHAPDGKTRIRDCISLLNYGYGVVSIYKDENPTYPQTLEVKGGKKDAVTCKIKNNFSHIFLSPYETSDITTEVEMMDDIRAPITAGDTLGMLVYKYKDSPLGSVDIVAAEDVEKANYTDYLWRMIQMWAR